MRKIRIKIPGFEILTPRERLIYKARLQNSSFRKIGENFGVSGERIRQIEDGILRKLNRFDNPSPYGNLSVRAENALKDAGIKNLKEAKKLSDFELLSIRNLGKKTMLEIRGRTYSNPELIK